jgi:hypothetical protein
LFIGYLRAGDKRIGLPQPPTPITDRDREQAEVLVRSVVANLDALNAGEQLRSTLEVSD